MYTVTFLPKGISVEVDTGTTVLQAQIAAQLHPDAPCGSNGTCGKCRVQIGEEMHLSCQTIVDRDMTVILPEEGEADVLTAGIAAWTAADGENAYTAAFDIGTTTLAGYLLDGKTGQLLSTASALNPQTQYGADVISRIQAAMNTKANLQNCIVRSLRKLIWELASRAGISAEKITLVTIAGNTAMHHLLLGIDPAPLVTPPYMPKVFEAMELPSKGFLPISPWGEVRVLPNIAGFVGADTVGCMVATDFGHITELTLMIDIGTNGEMVLGNRDRRISCSTAAGPAFEGAKISCGMRGRPGAIDHVWLDKQELRIHVIGDTEPVGICGSGLLDLVACMLDKEILDESGYLEGKKYRIPGTGISLTQADIREVQLAKAAIRAGIELMCGYLGVKCDEIQQVLLAGAFGNYLSPASACRIGMIPPVLESKIVPIGNAAGEGAKLCAISREHFEYSKTLAAGTEFLELASRPEFQDCFVDALEFSENDEIID